MIAAKLTSITTKPLTTATKPLNTNQITKLQKTKTKKLKTPIHPNTKFNKNNVSPAKPTRLVPQNPCTRTHPHTTSKPKLQKLHKKPQLINPTSIKPTGTTETGHGD
ncbi:hypothetical protein KC19_12G128400 [Ceratodon purpureus]|uniref:Uncharacterized protein n=1 Tax=Ceratodon purpureus TaxID=3225 RepID=A0A8T0G6K5_CERPU|nr:hypothetical protein KC19_12G128400 [Ceratodon purpureus]